ncbi:MAG: CoA-binding protein [Flammeovirgaceae bacterium]|jgi:predicted CoA-binding protein|nr:CoA-binding protein [Flammeovirgaceae bacterium]
MDKTTKKTVIVGASTNPSRYAFMAAERLVDNHHEIVPIGVKSGEVFGKLILDIGSKPSIEDVDTITLYLGPQHQPEHYEYLLSLKPKRVIFNPGTENVEFEKKVEESGAEALEACTLVMLSTGQY